MRTVKEERLVRSHFDELAEPIRSRFLEFAGGKLEEKWGFISFASYHPPGVSAVDERVEEERKRLGAYQREWTGLVDRSIVAAVPPMKGAQKKFLDSFNKLALFPVPQLDGTGRYEPEELAIILQSYLGFLPSMFLSEGRTFRSCKDGGEGSHSFFSCKLREIHRHNAVVMIIAAAIVEAGIHGRVVANDPKKYRVPNLNTDSGMIEPGDIVIFFFNQTFKKWFLDIGICDVNAPSYAGLDMEKSLHRMYQAKEKHNVESSRAWGAHSVQIVMTQHGVLHPQSYKILMEILGIDKPVLDHMKRPLPVSDEQKRRIAIMDKMMRLIVYFLAKEAAHVLSSHV
jgi:hypothetical protein